MSNIRYKLIFATLFTVLFLAGCEYNNERLEIKNLSRQKISVLYSNTETIDKANNLAFYESDRNLIFPDSSMRISIPGKDYAWHRYINRGSKKKLFIYMFSVDSLRRYDSLQNMSELVGKKKFLEEKQYTEDELNKNNWLVVYQSH